MRLRLSTHFALLMLLVGAATALLDPAVGMAYLVACAALMLPLAGVWHVPQRYFYVVLFTAAAIWLTHLARAPMLILLPEAARFHRVAQLDSALGVRVLLQIGLAGLLLLLGLVMGFRLFAGPAEPVPPSARQRRPFLADASAVMALLCVGVLLARACLQMGLELNTKNVANPTFGFLQRILPDGLIYPIALLYLAKYRNRISPFEAILFGGSVLGLTLLVTLSGSRQAFAAIALALFIFFLAHRGDFRIGAVRAWLLGLGGAWLLMLTFAIADPLRGYLEEQGGYGDEVVDVMVGGARSAFDPAAFLINGNLVSKRVSGGLDGMLAVSLSQPTIVLEAFSPGRIVRVVLGKLVPRYGAGDEMVTGKALAVAYSGVSMEHRQASAVGMFAALQLAFGPRGSFVAAFAFGLLWGAFFAWAERPRDPDLTFLLHFTGMQQVIVWVLSGNFDIVIPGAIRSLAYIAAFGALAVVMATAARAGGARAPLPEQPGRVPAA